MEVQPTPIAPEEALNTMRNDIVVLISRDPICPLARAIAKALLDIDAALVALNSPPQP